MSHPGYSRQYNVSLVIAFIAALFIVAFVLVWFTGSLMIAATMNPVSHPRTNPQPSITLTPCPDDGAEHRDCYWDATHHGDGSGASFVDIDGTTYYCEDTLTDTPFTMTSEEAWAEYEFRKSVFESTP